MSNKVTLESVRVTLASVVVDVLKEFCDSAHTTTSIVNDIVVADVEDENAFRINICFEDLPALPKLVDMLGLDPKTGKVCFWGQMRCAFTFDLIDQSDVIGDFEEGSIYRIAFDRYLEAR